MQNPRTKVMFMKHHLHNMYCHETSKDTFWDHIKCLSEVLEMESTFQMIRNMISFLIIQSFF
jgi:hypothetical protein